MKTLPKVEDALGYSRNYAAASPYLNATAKEHINGLCDLLEATNKRLREPLEAIEHALKMGFPANEVLDENSPIRDGIRAALLEHNASAQGTERSEVPLQRVVGQHGADDGT